MSLPIRPHLEPSVEEKVGGEKGNIFLSWMPIIVHLKALVARRSVAEPSSVVILITTLTTAAMDTK